MHEHIRLFMVHEMSWTTAHVRGNRGHKVAFSARWLVDSSSDCSQPLINGWYFNLDKVVATRHPD